MTTLLIGMLGGGALVQLVQLIMTRRQNIRQLNAAALGAEVQALESAIDALRRNLDAETERHEKMRCQLEKRIEALEARIASLKTENENLRMLVHHA